MKGMIEMPKESTEVRKKQIIEATLSIAAEKGLSALTTAEVARRVGFSEAALFRHFPNKLEMLKAAMTMVHQSLFSGIVEISRKEIGPLTKLEDILWFQLEFIEKNRGISRILFSDELHLGNRDLRDTVVKLHQNYLDVISSVIEEGMTAGILRQDLEVIMAARAFFGMIQTAVFSWSLRDFAGSLRQQFNPISRFLRGCFMQKYYCL